MVGLSGLGGKKRKMRRVGDLLALIQPLGTVLRHRWKGRSSQLHTREEGVFHKRRERREILLPARANTS